MLSDIDPDAGDTAAFALTNDAGGLFAISNGNLVTTAPLDFEQAASHTVTVQVTDSAGATFSKDIQIGVTNVNEAPTDITLSNASVPENAPGGTVGRQPRCRRSRRGRHRHLHARRRRRRPVRLAASLLVTTAPLDYEQAASHQITVRATDAGGLTVDKTFTIATTNVNEAPTAVLLSNSSVAENSAAGTIVGALSAVDPDAGDTATFTLTDSCRRSVRDLERQSRRHRPASTSSRRPPTRSPCEPPMPADCSTTPPSPSPPPTSTKRRPTYRCPTPTLPQGAANGTVVGALSAIDLDAGDTATFSLVDNDGGQFAVSGGNLVVAGALTAGPQQVDVRATDSGGLTFDKVLTVTVNSGSLVVGTAGPDMLVGTAGDDTIQGLGGNDRLQGLAGNDILDGGQGLDRAIYTDATSGIAVNMAAGTVTERFRLRHARQRRRRRRQRLRRQLRRHRIYRRHGHRRHDRRLQRIRRPGRQRHHHQRRQQPGRSADAHLLCQRHGGRHGRSRRAHGHGRRLGRHRHAGRQRIRTA